MVLAHSEPCRAKQVGFRRGVCYRDIPWIKGKIKLVKDPHFLTCGFVFSTFKKWWYMQIIRVVHNLLKILHKCECWQWRDSDHNLSTFHTYSTHAWPCCLAVRVHLKSSLQFVQRDLQAVYTTTSHFCFDSWVTQTMRLHDRRSDLIWKGCSTYARTLDGSVHAVF